MLLFLMFIDFHNIFSEKKRTTILLEKIKLLNLILSHAIAIIFTVIGSTIHRMLFIYKYKAPSFQLAD